MPGTPFSIRDMSGFGFAGISTCNIGLTCCTAQYNKHSQASVKTHFDTAAAAVQDLLAAGNHNGALVKFVQAFSTSMFCLDELEDAADCLMSIMECLEDHFRAEGMPLLQ
jgi:hypothetical protein